MMRLGTLGTVTTLALASLTACASELDPDVERVPRATAASIPAPFPETPLEQARKLASRDAWLGSALQNARTLAPAKDGFRSVDADRGDTASAAFGARTTGPFSLRAGKRNVPLAVLTVTGMADVPLTLTERELTAEIAPGVTAMYGLTGESLEQFVLSSQGIPAQFSWHLSFPEGAAGTKGVERVEKDGSGHLAFVRGDGRAVLRVPHPYAVDETGQRLDVGMTWTARHESTGLLVDVAFVTPDGHGRPLLVDPALEVVFWQEARGAAPPSRYSAAFAYHPELGASVVYGGTGFDALSDTWAFDGTWRQLGPKTGAPARYGHAMSYIAATSSLVAFGGRDQDGALSRSTLLWNGSTWTDAGVPGPPMRDDHAMTYAPVLGKLQNVAFLFGGSANAGAIDDTWTWNGTAWSALTVPGGPDERYGHDLFYDDARKSVVVFGGARATLLLGDVVDYDGSAWTALTPAPTARTNAAMAFDTKRKTGVLFGGLRTLDDYAQGTWEWHSADGTWLERIVQVAPVARAEAVMAYDPKRERAVMFGGAAGSSFLETAETWEYGVLGGACTSAADCDQYACVDGACCEAARCGPCSRCSVATGACEPVVNGDDPDSCAGASTCDENGACKKKLGAACAIAGDCVSGVCADGVCCNRSCDGTCEACDTASKPGSCTLVRGEPRHGACDGAPPCGSACTGESATCTYGDSGSSCGSACQDGKVQERSCDGKGACKDGASAACPNDLRCADESVCLTACARDADCVAGLVCRDGTCAASEQFCEDTTTLRHVDGSTESCAPYRCLSGACLPSCSLAAECAAGLVCDSEHRCIEPPSSASHSGDSGCGCAVPGSNDTRPDAAAYGVALLLAAALRRRRQRAFRVGTSRPAAAPAQRTVSP